MSHKARARIARPLLEFVQNFGFAHLLKEYAANAPRLKVGFIIAYLEWVSKHARFMTKSEENLKKSVDSGFEICYNHLRQRHKFIGELCNGSTYDSDSYCLGSNPSSPAICLHGQAVKTLPSQGKIMGSIPIGGATKQNDCVLFFYLPEMSTSEILRKFRFPPPPVPSPSLRFLKGMHLLFLQFLNVWHIIVTFVIYVFPCFM